MSNDAASGTVTIGINGFGRMGRLAARELFQRDGVILQRINEIAGTPECAAHLWQFDSVHGQWHQSVVADGNHLQVGDQCIAFTQESRLGAVDWSDCDIVIDCTGAHKTVALLQEYLQQGVKKVVVSAPVKEDGVINIVYGVNDDDYQPQQHTIVTAASCTTNCLAPMIKVLQEQVGIVHGCITTIHDMTNTQSILDQPHKDLRRARASSLSLIPTTTGSATAIGMIFPELQGKLNGIAVRVPLANASLTDAVLELKKTVTKEQVNAWFAEAAAGSLRGILGYEERPLVSVDYTNDTRSAIIDGLSTMVIGGTQLKLLAWYDNEQGYVCRMVDLTCKVARSL